MNKLLTITSGLLATSSVFAEFSASALHVDAKVEFNTADVYEGRRRLDQSFAPNLEVGLPVLDDGGKLNAGVGANLSVRHKSFGGNEVAPYVGFSYDVTDMFTVDLGYTLRSLDKRPIVGFRGVDESSHFKVPFVALDADGTVGTGPVGTRESAPLDEFLNTTASNVVGTFDDNGRTALAGGDIDNERLSSLTVEELKAANAAYTLEGKKQFHEIYTGIMADVLLNPALYFAYDFTQKKANINGAVHHTFDLSSCGVTGFAIDLGGKVGYTRVKKPYGIAHDTQVSFVDLEGVNWVDIAAETDPNVPHAEGDLFKKTCWFYTGVNADLVYSLNENAKARAGVAFSYNNAPKDSWINERNHKKHNVWFSSAIEFTF